MPRTSLLLRRLLTPAAVALLVFLFLHSPAAAQERLHVVAPGENLSTIAQRYGLTLGELSAYNGITNPNMVFVGQQLSIPGSGRAPQSLAPAVSDVLPGDDGYYTVARGDTLSLIARNYGMTTDDLMRLNGIANANMVWVGQKLRVSARAAALAQPAAAAGCRDKYCSLTVAKSRSSASPNPSPPVCPASPSTPAAASPASPAS